MQLPILNKIKHHPFLQCILKRVLGDKEKKVDVENLWERNRRGLEEGSPWPAAQTSGSQVHLGRLSRGRFLGPHPKGSDSIDLRGVWGVCIFNKLPQCF